MKFAGGFLAGFCLVLLPFGWAWGQATPTPDPGIDDNLKQQTDLTAAADQISQAISTEAQKLANDSDGVSQGMARDWLIAQSLGGDQYRDAYDQAVNKALAAILANPQTSVRTRV